MRGRQQLTSSSKKIITVAVEFTVRISSNVAFFLWQFAIRRARNDERPWRIFPPHDFTDSIDVKCDVVLSIEIEIAESAVPVEYPNL